MTRSIKIAASRTVFIAACLVPLIGSISFAAWQRWIDSDSLAAAWIASRLGTGAEVQALRTSTPGVETAHSVKLLDPENGKLIAVCRDVRVQRGSSARVVSIASVDVPPGQMMALWRMLHERVLRQQELLATELIISVDRLALRDREGQVEIDGLRIESQRQPRGPRLAISFRPAGDLDRRPVRINLFRDQTAEPPVTRLEIQSHDQALDCSLVTGSPVWLQRFGDAIRFQGTAWLELQADDWRGEITGQVEGIGLQRLADAGLLPPMSGLLTLDIVQAIFARGRLVSFNGVISAGPGTISAAALRSMTALGVAPKLSRTSAEPRTLPDAMLDYDALAVMAQLDASGIALMGILPPRDQGIAMTGGGAAMIRSAAAERVPVATLIEWVTGQAVPEALFTEAGAALYGILPMVETP